MLIQKVAFLLKANYFAMNPSKTMDNYWKQLHIQAKISVFERIFYSIKWEKSKSFGFQAITRVHIRFSIVPHFVIEFGKGWEKKLKYQLINNTK